MDQKKTDLSTDAARQGVTGHGVRYVLGYSLLLAICTLALTMVFAR